jgi:CheY-like chemotaxis protein
MRVQDGSADAPVTGIRVLVADDEARVRSLVATLLRAATGVVSVIEAEDGVEAVELGRQENVDVAVLDLNMPCMSGVEAALKLGALQPSARIALHSSDPVLLRQHAAALELPLFDKVDFERLRAWVELQATEARTTGRSGRVAPTGRRLDLCCSVCGYGVVCRPPPERCPMCGGKAGWNEPGGAMARRAARGERLAG